MSLNAFLTFSSITLEEPCINKHSAKANVNLYLLNGKKNCFTLQLSYDHHLSESDRPFLRMAFVMPLLNYGLFSEQINLQFPISKVDKSLLNQLNKVFSRDIFVNKILRRRAPYILPDYFPDVSLVKPSDALPHAQISFETINDDNDFSQTLDPNRCGILSSGGKESLLTYGILKELNATVYPLYINESGGHWRTAQTAYKYHKEIDEHTAKVWTNVDRFYNFMLDNLPFIRKDHRNIQADTYPLRLCIFPFYIFALLPVFTKHRIGHLLLGSEFDDQRCIPFHQGIPHYFGIYDQHQDFDRVMNTWYAKRIPSMVQWSAVRSISGLIVERILVNRYPTLSQLQRSCHSCHIDNDSIVPCGRCSKCLGVMLFLLANHIDPKLLNFQDIHIDNFQQQLETSSLRLDEDEKNHSLHLANISYGNQTPYSKDHVEMIHVDTYLCDPYQIPEPFRRSLYQLFERYTKGYCTLKTNEWIPILKDEIFPELS